MKFLRLKILEDDYKVAVDVWSITSYKELRRDAWRWSVGTCFT
jgi:pyruvate dehydrogenase complex dehydrogenase (E1) component